jgi:hypothetical protein
MKTANELKVDTWLPVFPGFYETIFDGRYALESEMDYYDEEDPENQLTDEEQQKYIEDYDERTALGATEYIEETLKNLGIVEKITYQAVNSPAYYNFTNDSVDIQVTLTPGNKKNIRKYIDKNNSMFEKYVSERYTSYDGFISRHPNDSSEWIRDLDECLEHKHRLGAILDFICLNEGVDDEAIYYSID